jgi:hypothetical protein
MPRAALWRQKTAVWVAALAKDRQPGGAPPRQTPGRAGQSVNFFCFFLLTIESDSVIFSLMSKFSASYE